MPRGCLEKATEGRRSLLAKIFGVQNPAEIQERFSVRASVLECARPLTLPKIRNLLRALPFSCSFIDVADVSPLIIPAGKS